MSCHTLTSYFVLTKIQFQIMQLMFHFLISVTITLFLARLTSMYHENISIDGEVKHINKTLLNIFRKKIKCDYCEPPWINDNIKSSLKQRSNLTKVFYNIGLRKSDRIKVLEKSAELTQKIFKAKKSIYLK